MSDDMDRDRTLLLLFSHVLGNQSVTMSAVAALLACEIDRSGVDDEGLVEQVTRLAKTAAEIAEGIGSIALEEQQ